MGMQRSTVYHWLTAYCFVKYTTVEEGDRAIAALHNRYTFPGARFSMKVRYADGEIERIKNPGDHFSKLYVMGLNVHATKWEIGENFSTYGFVEDTYIICDEFNQSRRRSFIHFACRDMRIAAKEALSGKFIMTGCDKPLFIRFADPKKPIFGHPSPLQQQNQVAVSSWWTSLGRSGSSGVGGGGDMEEKGSLV